MKSSDNKRNKIIFLSNGPLYSLLAIYMPLTILTAAVLLVEAIIPASVPVAILIASGGIGALAASFYCDFMNDAKSSRAAANIRGRIIILAVSYIFASLLRREIPWIEKFAPDISNITASVGAIYVWINVIPLKLLFSARRNFERYTELYKGEKLQTAIFEDSCLLIYTSGNIDKTKQNYFFQLVFIGVLVLICDINKIQLPLTLRIFLIAILAGGICIFGFFEIVKGEQYYAGEGIALSAIDRHKHIFIIFVFSLFCITAAFFLASDKSFLPFSLITGFFQLLFSLLHPSPLSNRDINSENFTNMDISPSLPSFGEITPSPTRELFLKYSAIILKYSLIIIVSAWFIWFMISPLLNRGEISKELTFRRRLFHIIAEWFNGVLAAIVYFFANLKSGKNKSKLRKYRAKEIRHAAETVFGAYSPAKKREMRRSATLFARLIIWGDEVRHVEWKPSLAPGEYCGILATAAPPAAAAKDAPGSESSLQRRNRGIIRCGELFEQALYSAEVLSDEEREEFKNFVEEITAADA